jgi:hypothetical protein
MEQAGEAEVPFSLSCGQKNETNLPAKIPEMVFSVYSDFSMNRFPFKHYFFDNYYFRTELSVSHAG